jgi:hypothetical protein
LIIISKGRDTMKVCLAVVLCALLVLGLTGVASAAPVGRSAGLRSWVTVSNPRPRVGQEVTVTVWLDAAAKDLGSYSASLQYDARLLRVVSVSGAPENFMGVVNDKAPGVIRFNGVKIDGEGGLFVPLRVTFVVREVGGSVLDLAYTAAAQARTFDDLLSQLTTHDSGLFMRR